MPEPAAAHGVVDRARAPSLGEVVAALDALYPPALAEEWDTGIGLACGDPDAPVRSVLLAVDATETTVDEALSADADLLLTHHPLLFRPVQSVALGTGAGRVLHRAIRAGAAGLALFAAHTNADSARPGVSDALAQAVGLVPGAPLEPRPHNGADEDLLVTYVPNGDVEQVVDALAAAGAGDIGDYSRCAYLGSGEGTFVPGEGTHPAIGSVGARERVAETRLEMVVPRARRADVVAALRSAHRYEEVAYHLMAKDSEPVPGAAQEGLGRVCRPERPMTLQDFARRVTAALPVGPGGVRVSGDPDGLLETVAVCGGAGDSLLPAAGAAGVDAYLTADLRHHPASDAAAEGLALLDAGHYATEWPWLDQAARRLQALLAGQGLAAPQCRVSTAVTDPWSAHLPGSMGTGGQDEG